MGTEPVAVITGASQGLGLALADALAERHWRLIIDGRDDARLQAAASHLRGRGATAVVAIAGDVSDAAHRDALASAARAAGTALDLVVNNASTLGATPLPSLRTYPLDELARAFAVNAIAPVALLQQLLPLAARGAAVINITSDAAVEGYEGWGGYGASKAALEQLSRVLAAEEPDVRVYWVDPGDLRTQMHQDAFPGEDISDRPPPSVAVPSLLALVDGTRPSGRYRAQHVLDDAAVA